MSLTPLRFSLPLPISKNRRVRLGRKEVLSVARDGAVTFTNKTVAINSKEWEAYKVLVFQIVQWELRLTIPHPELHERIVFECTWLMKSERSDCVNFHDLLADALKVAFEIDDRFFLIRDVWSSVCEEGRPRVEIAAWRAEHPAPPGRGSKATSGLP